MSHTPGPWMLNGWDIVQRGCDDSFPPIAIVGNARRTLTLEEIGANARLIAAAPELLAALRAAKEFIAGHNECMDRTSPHGGDQEWFAHCDNLFSDCEAAIAKAEGRE